LDQALFDILEFNKILALVAERTLSPIARNWFLATTPSTDIEQIKHSLSQVSELRAIIDYDESFPLEAFNDITGSIRKASVIGNFLNLQEFIELKKISVLSRKICLFLKERKDKTPLLNEIASEMQSLREVENEIDRVIDEPSLEVKDNASKTLSRLRNELRTNQDRIRRKLEAIQKSWAEKTTMYSFLNRIK